MFSCTAMCSACNGQLCSLALLCVVHVTDNYAAIHQLITYDDDDAWVQSNYVLMAPLRGPKIQNGDIT